MCEVNYAGGLSYDGLAFGTRVQRFQLIDGDTILLDWVSRTGPSDPLANRFLGVAERNSSGEFVTPWVYLLPLDGAKTALSSSRIRFAIVHHESTVIKIVGIWEEDDEQTKYNFEAILHTV